MAVPMQSWEIAKDYVLHLLNFARTSFNEYCKPLEPWQIAFLTLGSTILVTGVVDFVFQPESLKSRLKKKFFRIVRSLPFAKQRIAKELDKATATIEASFAKDLQGKMGFVQRLPAIGKSQEDVVSEAKKYKSLVKVDMSAGHLSGCLYHDDAVTGELSSKIYSMFTWTNPLHPDVFIDIRKMEAEIVRMCCTMFNGDEKTCGVVTAGGTESILLACKAYRDRAIENGIRHPEILAPRTAHAAFEKAAQCFGLGIKFVPSDPHTLTVDLRKMKSMITKNTCMLVGSCPEFPLGLMDPIAGIGELGIKYGIPVHVDACLGSFVVAFAEKAGYKLPPFDFAVPGVTSISCDTHKYGFAPKGSSVIMFRSKDYRKYQYFVVTDWPGGIYATPTIGGSRPGGISAACWATMLHFGESGYTSSAEKIILAARRIKEGLQSIKGLHLFGDPQLTVIAFGSLDFDVYRLSDALADRGWHLNSLQFPPGVHICVTLVHTKTGVVDNFLKDVRQCTEFILSRPREKASGAAALYGMSQKLPDRNIVSEIAQGYLDAVYMTGSTGAANGTSAH